MVAVWHVPQLYDAAAENEWIHVLEHVCFVVPALVFWGALLDAPPVRAESTISIERSGSPPR
jgi:cytochrome c oxidase assembly factor CtaG